MDSIVSAAEEAKVGNIVASRSSYYWVILLTLTALALGWVLAYRQTPPPAVRNLPAESPAPVVSGAMATAAFGDSIIFNAAAGNSIKLTLQGDVATSSIANPRNGQFLMLLICQDEAGAHRMSWPSNVMLAGGILTVSEEPHQCDSLTMVYDGTFWMETTRAQQIADPQGMASEPLEPLTDDPTRRPSPE